MKSLNKKLRYPGVYSFSSSQESVFFGRDEDIERLQTLIEVEKQVLLYSKSGVGKTSLLNAGVIPKLPDEYEVINIRFFAYNNSMPPAQRVGSIIAESYQTVFANKQSIIDSLIKQEEEAYYIWYYLKKLQIAKPHKIFILVFDQFEELFSYPKEEIEDFKQQLFEINKRTIPQLLFDRIKKEYRGKNPEFLDEENFRFIHQYPVIKNVFAIRSDRLSLLNQLTDKIPKIQHIFYELKALNNNQAEEAIVNPAKIKDENFATSPWEFADDALLHIINTLSNNGSQYIENTQLQIICQRIEEIVLEKQKMILGNEIIKITKKDLPEFKDIFFSFYTNAVEQTGEIEKAHIFIEDQLIRNKQRISLDEIICKEYVNNKTLRQLTYAHLLRAEPNSTGGFSYELSHDTLVEPILISREKRKTKEEEIKFAKERQEELRIEKEKQDKIRIENEKKRKRQRQIIIIVSIAAAISMAFGVFGFVKMNDLQKQIAISEKEKVRADSLLDIAIINQKMLTSFIQNFFSFIDENEQSDDYIEWLVERKIYDAFRTNIVFIIKESGIPSDEKDSWINWAKAEQSNRKLAVLIDILGRNVARKYSSEDGNGADTLINKEIFGDYEGFEFCNLLLDTNRRIIDSLSNDNNSLWLLNLFGQSNSEIGKGGFSDGLKELPENSYWKYAAGLYHYIDTSQNNHAKTYYCLIDYQRLAQRLRVMADNYKKAGFNYLAIKSYESAIEVSEDASALFSDIYEYRKLLAETFYALEDYESAKNEYTKLQKDFPEEKSITKYLGVCYRSLEMYNDAINTLELYLEVKDDDIWALKNLMYSYSGLLQYHKAYDISKKLITIDSTNYNYYWNKSYYCLFINKPQEAILAAKKSLELAPEKTGVYTNLVLGYLLNDQYDEAKSIYLEWKDRPFPGEKHSFGEQFLEDIEELQEKGVAHKDFEKVKALLE